MDFKNKRTDVRCIIQQKEKAVPNEFKYENFSEWIDSIFSVFH